MKNTERYVNRLSARRLYEEVLSRARFDKLDEILSATIVWRDPLLPGGEVCGIEAFRQVLMTFRSAFPDLEIKLEDQFAHDDKVVSRFTITGTHKGELMGLRPTGGKISVSGISIIRFKDGRAMEEWIEEDSLGLMRQLGAIPPDPAVST